MTADPCANWDRRIRRAAELVDQVPSAADLLRFYESIARFQKSLCEDGLTAPLSSYLEPLLALVEQRGPGLLAEAAKDLRRRPEAWPALVDQPDGDPTHAFFTRVLRQPGAERVAARSYAALNETRTTCPFCAELPVAAVLKPEGEGGKRHLLCSMCFTQWSFRRLLCPHCGEEDRDQLPVYTVKEFPHVRIEACDSCKCYVKSVDLTVDGRAVAEVDELATVALDLWAAENSYLKVVPNLLGF